MCFFKEITHRRTQKTHVEVLKKENSKVKAKLRGGHRILAYQPGPPVGVQVRELMCCGKEGPCQSGELAPHCGQTPGDGEAAPSTLLLPDMRSVSSSGS